MVIVNTCFYRRKNLPEIHGPIRHAPSDSSTSLVLGPKNLKNICVKGHKIISLPEAVICVWPAVFSTVK